MLYGVYLAVKPRSDTILDVLIIEILIAAKNILGRSSLL